MKVYKLIILVILLFATISFAKGQSEIPIQNISTDNNAIYRLFSTQNIYTFIKLNTRNGKMWQVQWSMESKYRDEVILSDESCVYDKEDEMNGRFFLYPTSNIYQFILLDQIDGRTWQVQWSTDKDERGLFKLFDDDIVKMIANMRKGLLDEEDMNIEMDEQGYSLNGRSLGSGGLVQPKYKVDDEGTVVVNITVNPKGRVISAEIGRGTNTDNTTLRESAIEASRNTKFNPIKTADNQQGSITYKFNLN